MFGSTEATKELLFFLMRLRISRGCFLYITIWCSESPICGNPCLCMEYTTQCHCWASHCPKEGNGPFTRVCSARKDVSIFNHVSSLSFDHFSIIWWPPWVCICFSSSFRPQPHFFLAAMADWPFPLAAWMFLPSVHLAMLITKESRDQQKVCLWATTQTSINASQ